MFKLKRITAVPLLSFLILASVPAKEVKALGDNYQIIVDVSNLSWDEVSATLHNESTDLYTTEDLIQIGDTQRFYINVDNVFDSISFESGLDRTVTFSLSKESPVFVLSDNQEDGKYTGIAIPEFDFLSTLVSMKLRVRQYTCNETDTLYIRVAKNIHKGNSNIVFYNGSYSGDDKTSPRPLKVEEFDGSYTIYSVKLEASDMEYEKFKTLTPSGGYLVDARLDSSKINSATPVYNYQTAKWISSDFHVFSDIGLRFGIQGLDPIYLLSGVSIIASISYTGTNSKTYGSRKELTPVLSEGLYQFAYGIDLSSITLTKVTDNYNTSFTGSISVLYGDAILATSSRTYSLKELANEYVERELELGLDGNQVDALNLLLGRI